MSIKKNQCQFYIEKNVKPVYAKLNKAELFNSYEWMRRKLFEYNLGIPIRTFDNASLLEFGPSTGDNSLIFAHWGSKLSLIEPVEDFISCIDEYFTKHSLTENLNLVKCSTFENFETDDKFDFVIAEGFIFHTGQPAFWLPRLSSFSKKDGFVVISHLETVGFFIELLHSKCLQFFQSHYDKEPIALSKKMFYAKWSKVNHARNFDAWAYDNLIYPTLDAYLLNSLVDFQEIMSECGMLMWSSWPSVSNFTDVTWIKKTTIDVKDVIMRNRSNFLRLLPSMLVGKYIDVNEKINEVGESLFSSLTSHIKSLAVPIETLQSDYIEKVQNEHNKIGDILQLCVPYFNETVLATLWQEIDECLGYLSNGNIDSVIKLFNGNGPLSEYWGSPNFYSVWHCYDQTNIAKL